MKRKLLYILVPILVIIGIVAVYAYREYNREAKDNSKEKADVVITASELFEQFSTDETTANGLYLDKVVSVSGTVNAVEKDEQGMYTVLLESGDPLSNISCQMDQRHNTDAAEIQPGTQVTMKGTCTGILMDVVLIRCVIEK